MKSNKNEELKSRRDFFKKAAKSALPILGAVVLASSPLVSKAAEVATGCARNSCSRQCQDTCRNYCNGTCDTTCKNYGCKGYCNK
ncbi:MAG: Cys-Xaa-Xaa-Xaa repeat radical SAM target protein [Muribaculaceae bacterium]|nr:Cys-Xaa-Xaa-Xaa repeat radical SAM target protein [Muribaculaceae bacterium]